MPRAAKQVNQEAVFGFRVSRMLADLGQPLADKDFTANASSGPGAPATRTRSARSNLVANSSAPIVPLEPIVGLIPAEPVVETNPPEPAVGPVPLELDVGTIVPPSSLPLPAPTMPPIRRRRRASSSSQVPHIAPSPSSAALPTPSTSHKRSAAAISQRRSEKAAKKQRAVLLRQEASLLDEDTESDTSDHEPVETQFRSANHPVQPPSSEVEELRQEMNYLRAVIEAQKIAAPAPISNQPWLKNTSFKTPVINLSLAQPLVPNSIEYFPADTTLDGLGVSRVKPKSMEAAGMLRHVTNLISSDPDGALKQGTSVGFLCICSGYEDDVTSGLQLTRSKFLQLVAAGFYPSSLDWRYFTDISSLYSGQRLRNMMIEVRTENVDSEPHPVDASLGLVTHFEKALLNLFNVLDITFKLLSTVAHALYIGLVKKPTDWFMTHSFGSGSQNTAVAISLFNLTTSWLHDLHFLLAKRSIISVEHFISLASTGPVLNDVSYPFMHWLKLTHQEMSNADVAQPKSDKLLVNPVKPLGGKPGKPGNPGKPIIGAPSAPIVSIGKLVRELRGPFCASAVFVGAAPCVGNTCRFVHDPPAVGSREAENLKRLRLKYPSTQFQSGFEF